MCKNWREKGTCRYGDKCLFAHGEHELSRRQSAENSTESPAKKETGSNDESASQGGNGAVEVMS
jgi:hypothetical protein